MAILIKTLKIMVLFGFIGLSVTACAGAGTPLDAVSKVQRLQKAG
jgi:hypothetical protein